MIIKKIKMFLEQDPSFRSLGEISDEMQLVESGALDSFTVVKLMIFVEKEFNIKIDLADLTEENVASLKSIEKLIAEKLKMGKS